jgi:hypothetical protein
MPYDDYAAIGQAQSRRGATPVGASGQRGPGMYDAEQRYYNQYGALPPGAADKLTVQNGVVTPKADWLDKWGKYLFLAPAGVVGAGALGAIPGIAGLGSATGAGAGASSAAAGAGYAGAGGMGIGPAVAGETALGAGSAGAGMSLPSWTGSAITAGAGTANALMNRHAANDQQAKILAALMPFLNYQKQLMALSDPSAAQTFGIPVPQGATPTRQAVNQAVYQMLPLFARQSVK